ncbi:hypothetical protein [Pseudarthrobacter scleromae]|uniref:hypothetical protein n=1 Tax=Pseudarthrobacter scleromae TaxID=158897 RepID=UPI003D03A9FE
MKKWLLIVVLMVAVAVTAGVIVWHPWAAPSVAEGSSQVSARGEGWTAAATFPGEPGLRARVQQADPDDKQKAALPTATTLRALADFNVDGGQFPASGAQISFTLDEPLAADTLPAIAHWNEDSETWEPVEASLSEDRRTATTTVSHFSKYGFFDYLFNALGQVTGNAATSGVTCDQPMPDWADPQYFDDINSPVLWCGGKDAKNRDLLVAKLKMNRDTAAKVTLALEPAWAWSDLWQSSPTDLATMAAAAELPDSPFAERQYLVQPFGELHFGFTRSALEGLYYGSANHPLIQVETGWFYTAAALMWDQIGDMPLGDSPVAAVSSTMSIMDCGQALLTASSNAGAVDAFGDAMSCLGTQQTKDQLNRGVRSVLADRYPHLTNGWITVHSKTILSKFSLVGLGMKTADFSLKIFSAIGDATLPDHVRQFKFEPSVKAIRERAPQKKAYAGTQLGTNYTFKYPSGWKVADKKNFPYMAEVGIYDGKGIEMAGLSVMTSWDANSSVKLRKVAKSWETPSTGTVSAAGTINGGKTGASKFLVRTVIMDLTPYPEEASGLKWDKPVAVAVSAGLWDAPATELAPFLLTGVGAITATDTVNGQPYAPFVFASQRYFDTVAEAEAWTGTEEYHNVVDMIASFNG